jgi:hypothetical protein
MNKLSEKLGKHLETYTSDPSKRCYIHNVGEGSICRYSGKSIGINTKGCFIGALLPSKDRIKIDEYFGKYHPSDVFTLIKEHEKIGIKLPKFIKDNRLLMLHLQQLHDNPRYWTGYGLSSNGKGFLEEIINHHELNEKDFEKSLK